MHDILAATEKCLDILDVPLECGMALSKDVVYRVSILEKMSIGEACISHKFKNAPMHVSTNYRGQFQRRASGVKQTLNFEAWLTRSPCTHATNHTGTHPMTREGKGLARARGPLASQCSGVSEQQRSTRMSACGYSSNRVAVAGRG